MKITAKEIHGAGNLNPFIDSRDFKRTIVIMKTSVTDGIQSPANSTPTQCKIKGTINKWQGMLTGETFNVELFDIDGRTVTLHSNTMNNQLKPTSLSVTVTKQSDSVEFKYQLTNPSLTNVSTEFEVDITIVYDGFREDIIFTGQTIDFHKPVNYNKNVSIGGDVSIGGSLTIPSDKSVIINELQSGSISIQSITGGDVYINKLGYYMNPIDIGDDASWVLSKDFFEPHVFYRIKYKAYESTTFNNAVIMFETTNTGTGGINIGGTTGSADGILIAGYINSDGQACKWDDCSQIMFTTYKGGEMTLVGEIMEVNLIPLHLSFRTMFDE